MRVCFIGDGRVVHTQRWVQWFAREHQVKLITTGSVEPSQSDYPQVALPANCRRGTRLAVWVRETRRLVREYEPDLVHGHYINEAGWLAAACGRRPLVITALGSDLYRAPAQSSLAGRLNPWAVRRADYVTCDSADQARLIRSWGVPESRVGVIGWGVDRHAFHPAVDGETIRRRLDIPIGARVVLSPRQWLSNSNIPAVIAAHQKLPGNVYLILKRIPEFERDHAAAAVERAITSSAAADRIRVLGTIPAGELPGLYAAADVILSLCATDGTPVSVLEAMAIGRPVVALHNPSLAEWVAEPGGRLVSSLAPDQVAAALEPFLVDADVCKRAARHNLALVADRADRDAELRRMTAIYEQLAAR